MNWVLIAVIGIFVVLGIIGFKRGLIRMAFSLISTVVALVVAVLFSPAVSKAIANNEGIVKFFDEKISDVLNLEELVANEGDSAAQESVIDRLELPEAVKDALLENDMVKQFEEEGYDNFEEYVCRRITTMIINAIAFVVTFVLSVLVLTLLAKTLDLLAKLPVLKQINEMGGLAAGIAEGLLLIWIFFVVLTMFASSEFGKSAMKLIAENEFLDYLYQNNLLSQFVMRK